MDQIDSERHIYEQLILINSYLPAPKQPDNPKARLEAIDGSHNILRKSLKELQNSRLIYILLSFLILALLLLTTLVDNIGALGIILLCFQFVATLVLAFCLWMGLIVNKIEYSALMSACKAMCVLTNALMNEYNETLSTGFSSPIASPEIILWVLVCGSIIKYRWMIQKWFSVRYCLRYFSIYANERSMSCKRWGSTFCLNQNLLTVNGADSPVRLSTVVCLSLLTSCVFWWICW